MNDRPDAMPDAGNWGGLPVVVELDKAVPRSRVRVDGLVTAAALGRLAGGRAYLCHLFDGTGTITIAFTGRTQVPGLHLGATCRVDGTARLIDDRLVVCNPDYEIITGDGWR